MAGEHSLLRDLSGKSLRFKSTYMYAKSHAAVRKEKHHKLVFDVCLLTFICLLTWEFLGGVHPNAGGNTHWRLL